MPELNQVDVPPDRLRRGLDPEQDPSDATARLRARRGIPAEPAAVFEFLRDLDNHWELTGESVQRLAGHRDLGSRVRLRGPLGIGRVVDTRVLRAEPPWRMVGSAEIGSRTRGTVRWSIAPAAGGSVVELTATVDRAGPLDRLLLVLGGRRWLCRCFDRALAKLEERFTAPGDEAAGG